MLLRGCEDPPPTDLFFLVGLEPGVFLTGQATSPLWLSRASPSPRSRKRTVGGSPSKGVPSGLRRRLLVETDCQAIPGLTLGALAHPALLI